MKYLLPLAGLLLTGCVTRTYTVTTPPPNHELSVAEVQAMVQANVSESVIVNQIQNSTVRYALTTDQIIALKNAGASDAVLNALINSVNKAPAQTTTTVEQGPNVYPYVSVAPWPWEPYHYGGYYRYHRWH